MVLECSAGGPDKYVYPYLVEVYCKSIQSKDIEIDTQTNKKLLIENISDSVDLLINQLNCDKVFIIWDLHPGWGTKVCRKNDFDTIYKMTLLFQD